MDISAAVFYFIALVTIGSAVMVAFSRNIIYSAFSLLGTFMGVAGLYVFLGADFVAAVQLLIYVGGILILILFAVMLTHRITDVQITNRAAGRVPALILVAILLGLLVGTAGQTPWAKAKETAYAATTGKIGDLFLETYLLPFELASLVLLAALIGAVVIARKEIKEKP
ncbi:MAG TPA: NADH-quinone oxidoreductase subunit J [candidate division Zixibacteria bacterium]|nr:NADH-quinone oxidoreductase subunit J [candidate division Zixibacteria bacterium]